MPILIAPFCESLRVGGVKHPGGRAVAGDAVGREVGDMLRERRRTKAVAVVAHDPGHDADTPAGRSEGQGQRRPPSSANGRSPRNRAAPNPRAAKSAKCLNLNRNSCIVS
jgi:hypothetical protein